MRCWPRKRNGSARTPCCGRLPEAFDRPILMIAFFDTSVHIDVLRGTRPLAEVLAAIGNLPVRLSPVVASELLRGVSFRVLRRQDEGLGA
jgi:hypothetical protein